MSGGKDEGDVPAHVVVESRYLDLIQYIENQLDPSKRLKVENKTTLKEKIAEWALAQAGMIGRLKRVEEENKILRENKATTAPSYAAMASANTKGKNTTIINKAQQSKKVTLFLTSKSGEDAVKTKEKFMSAINPVADKIKVKAMRTTKKVLIVETDSEADAAKIIANPRLSETVRCEPPARRRPLVIVYDIPSKIDDKAIANLVYEQNYSTNMSKEEFDNNFKPRFRTGPRDKATCHYVVEVSAQMRNRILGNRRVYVEYGACDVKDYLVVARCHKCQDLGHVAKYCQKQETVCGHCAKTGHTKRDCPAKASPRVCVPCLNKKTKCTKQEADCPTYKARLQRLVAATDYGQ